MATSEKPFHLALMSAGPPPPAFLSKPARTMLLVTILVFLPFVVPPLQRRLTIKGQNYEEFMPRASELISFTQKSAPVTALETRGEVVSDAPSVKPPSNACNDQLIEDPENVMEFFNAALARTEAKEPSAITRITHYGDSPITNDGITGTV